MVESLTHYLGKCTVSCSDEHSRAELGCHAEFLWLTLVAENERCSLWEIWHCTVGRTHYKVRGSNIIKTYEYTQYP